MINDELYKGINVDKLYNIELKCYNRTHYNSHWGRMYIIYHLYKFLMLHQIYISNFKKCAQEGHEILKIAATWEGGKRNKWG